MKDLLKFITCGSVDDGKSTLIGHILYDSKLLYADQERALVLDSKVGSRGGEIDYSLLLDGLTEEREQGITIDVAYRYFTTDARSFIVADTPGHEEYTRNMAVGASFADLAVILVDASKGVLVQTRRHARIAALMGIRFFVFAVNKMDLVAYSEERFRAIAREIAGLSKELRLENVTVIPVSATEGDNVTRPSENMPWYHGGTLLSYLENVDVGEASREEGFYMPVQRVSRPTHEFRGFQGQIETGRVSVGDELTTYPSRETARVKEILVTDREAEEASTGEAVTISLDREVDTSRGCVLASGTTLPVSDAAEATILWMDDAPLTRGKNFFVKIGTRQIPGMITDIYHKINVNTGEQEAADILHKNEIALVKAAFTEKIVLDVFARHRTLGELILIDRISYQTSACGVIEKVLDRDIRFSEGRVTRELRAALEGQAPVTVKFRIGEQGITREIAEETEKQLVLRGRHTYLYAPDSAEHVEEVVTRLNHAGIVVLLVLKPELAGEGIFSFTGLEVFDVGTVGTGSAPLKPETGAGGAEEQRIRDIVEYILEKTSYNSALSVHSDYI